MEMTGKNLKFPRGKERTALLTCIGISLLIWSFTKLSKVYETTRTVQIDYILPPLMEFTETPLSSLTTEVKGQGLDLARGFIANRNPSITIDLSEYARTEVQRNVLIAKIEEELSVEVKDIDRNYLLFSIDSTTTRKIPVALTMQIDFARDFFMKDSARMSVDSVIISGALNEIQQLRIIETELCVASEVKTDIRRKLKLKTEGFKTLKTLPEEIEVFIPVEQFTEKSFELPVKAVNVTDSVQILPSSVQATCIVGMSRYGELDPTDFIVEADFAKVINIDAQNSVSINLTKTPQWVKSVKLQPKSVEYLIVK